MASSFYASSASDLHSSLDTSGDTSAGATVSLQERACAAIVDDCSETRGEVGRFPHRRSYMALSLSLSPSIDVYA